MQAAAESKQDLQGLTMIKTTIQSNETHACPACWALLPVAMTCAVQTHAIGGTASMPLLLEPGVLQMVVTALQWR